MRAVIGIDPVRLRPALSYELELRVHTGSYAIRTLLYEPVRICTPPYIVRFLCDSILC